MPQIHDIVRYTACAAQGEIASRKKSFSLFGYDIMVDENLNVSGGRSHPAVMQNVLSSLLCPAETGFSSSRRGITDDVCPANVPSVCMLPRLGSWR